MAREYLVITGEGDGYSSWGTFVPGGGGTVGGPPLIIQLTDSNLFTLRKTPVRWTIRSAGGYNRRVLSGSFKTMTTGALNNLVLFGSQTAQLLRWIQPISAGSGFDLPSCTIDHAIVMEDGSNTTIYQRYLGVKVAGWQFTSNSDASLCRLSLTSLIARSCTNDISFADPLYSSYPVDAPFVHQHATTVTINTDRSVTGFDQFTATGRHLLDPRFFNSTNLSYLKYCGRDMDWSVTFPYVLKTDRTALFENTGTGFGVQPVTMTITYTIPASHSMTLNFEGNSLIGSVTDDLNFNQLFMQNITGWSQVDSSALTDFAATST
jgi:hypothetical protein